MKPFRFPRSSLFKRSLSLGLAFLLAFTAVVLFQSSLPAANVQLLGQSTTASQAPAASDTASDYVVDTQPLPATEPTAIAAPATAASPTASPPAATPTTPPASDQPSLPGSENNPSNTGQPTDNSKPEGSKPSESSKPNPAATAPAKSPEEVARWWKLAEADKLYREGNTAAAEKIYRQVKAPFTVTTDEPEKPQPFSDPAQLSPGGKVYWREAQAGLEQKLDTRIFVPLQLLVEKEPAFMPGPIALAQALQDKGKPDEAVAVLERASSVYPDQPDLLRAKIELLAKTEHWIEASIAARQFALLHADNPAAPEFTALADQHLKRYQSRLKSRLTGNLIGNIITGALGYAFTGNLFGPLSAIQTTALMLRGESAIGERYAKQAERQLDMVDDPDVLSYVDGIGQKLAKVAGRNEFHYKFYVVNEEDLNAFALPGGKVFVNAGAIVKANSEAELAGLLGHELSHAVLSHGFQLITESNLTANVFQFIPFGGLLNDLVVLNYSRDMERQADILGTRLSSAEGYAADGLRNLMVTLKQEDKGATVDFLSSHPVTDERVKYLEQLINQNGYNRYAYEGVEQHAQIQTKVRQLLQDKKERDDKKRHRR